MNNLLVGTVQLPEFGRVLELWVGYGPSMVALPHREARLAIVLLLNFPRGVAAYHAIPNRMSGSKIASKPFPFAVVVVVVVVVVAEVVVVVAVVVVAVVVGVVVVVVVVVVLLLLLSTSVVVMLAVVA